jgi:hypothetical protein
MKKIALTLLAMAFLVSLSVAKDTKAATNEKSHKISGWISDAKCAATKGAMASHADCAKKCISSGQPAVFVSDKGKKIFKIDNQDAIKGHEGEHVKVTGQVTHDTLHIDSIAMLKQPKSAKKSGGM